MMKSVIKQEEEKNELNNITEITIIVTIELFVFLFKSYDCSGGINIHKNKKQIVKDLK